ncbi:hypothetical protein BDP27DRAFT_1315936 [Rhodocollybia butyracea]|uniref:Transcription factor BYE1 n=1 Tax=Rhodocollybia butyracea TaxID=206335 RepID=A0A9P5PZA4_9AGAR|nr:hypothetical protein BDP27DRAFT_1315936 [Rhodocollybia butyracea]
MSPRTTRSTRSSKQTASTSPAPASKNTPKSSKPSSKSQDVESQAGKENKNVQETDTDMTVDTKGKNPVIDSQIASSTTTVSDQLFCTCKKGDDGTPMIHCAECKDWFHFSCINLDETDAEDISVFVCPACSEKTSLHSLMSWEEADPVEEARPKKSGPLPIAPKPRKKSKTPKDSIPTEKAAAPELEPLSSSEDSEDDDYVIEARAKGGRGTRRSRRAPSYHSESDLSDLSDEPTTRLRKASSPTLKRIAKRSSEGPPTKKAKTTDPLEDPTRRYCLGKLEDVFRDIFLRYPHVRSKSEDSGSAAQVMEKRKEDLTEEERTAVLEDSKQFADDLEKCVFEIYSEPDKHGNSAAAAKYKDRFRMLQFNLSKVDRVMLHKRVASGLITLKEISLMSSTDLANEELKQSIKSAEQESLEQSILTKTTAPRTKITHKGLEDIEDISGRDITRERERQLEEEERMERERLARLRTIQPRQRTMSVSVPPESPLTPSSESWGAPPPVPAHAFDTSKESLPIRPSLITNASPEPVATEPELNLADLINIDDEPGWGQETVSPDYHHSPSESTGPAIVRSPTGISPFAIQGTPSSAPPAPAPAPEVVASPSATQSSPSPPPTAQPTTPRAPAFDLNSLWSMSNLSKAPSVTVEPTSNPEASIPKDKAMEGESVTPNDQDFDMFLEEKESETPEAAQATFDALPQVWSGKINMPLDSSVLQETLVIGRQMGGRHIELSSGQWKTLFPSDTLRIDGRVPVPNSAKFLLQMRMNSSKELVAVAFSSVPDADDSGFKSLSEFLINKGRHGLVFPWGNRPKDHHPGKELYIIPLLSSEPLPDYIELLDDLKLPKLRIINFLVGIWILNKGKLASPPPQAVPPPPVAAASHVMGSISPPPPLAVPIVSPPHIASPPIVPVAATNTASLPPTIDQNALAAELASLTPEQLAAVTQMLAQTNPGLPLALPVVPPAVTPPPGPSGAPIPLPLNGFMPSWGGQPSYGGSRGNHQFSSGPGGDFNSRGRDHRGARGGRGRGRGRGEDFNMNAPVDSGWPRRNSGPPRRW